ncbi:MAG: tRNA epoxyqueuosine(34) reductase QueG [Clostridia bacterium]|nr:tRNA epoxyqueuosine(34) reductase QueG [Clostridia bacterium]
MVEMNEGLTLRAIRTFMQEQDVPIVGITFPERDQALDVLLMKHKETGNYIYFGDSEIGQRQDYEAVLPFCKTIIVIGVPYNSLESASISEGPLGDGTVSNMAWEYDYHTVVKEKLALLEAFIRMELPKIGMSIQVDTGPLVDRHIAYRAGLGSYAKNQGLMHERYGTEFYIGYLLLDQVLMAHERVSPQPLKAACCENCQLCIRACPSGALSEENGFLGPRCISYLTQKKHWLSWEEREWMKDAVYGCDRCQIACPRNRHKPDIPSAYKRISSNRLDLKVLIGLSNKQLLKRYQTTGFVWRGPNVLKRNAIIALGNKGDATDVAFLEPLLTHASDYLVPYILWALWKCGDADIFERCQKTLNNSEDAIIKKECREILQLIK